MTEHDTPSTAHTEAEGLDDLSEWLDRALDSWEATYDNDSVSWAQAIVDAVLSSPWMRRHDEQQRRKVLAQVREGLKALPGHRARQNTSYGYKEVTIIERADALAVVDRLEGKP